MTVLWLLVIAFVVLGRLVRVENGPTLDRPIDPRVLDLYVTEWRRRMCALGESETGA